MKVKDIISNDVVIMSPSAPIIEVAHQMKMSRTGVIPICDHGKFRGVITERDIVIGITASTGDVAAKPVGSVMNNHSPTISSGIDIVEAARIMANNCVRVLPVVQNGKLFGLFYLEDLAQESPALATLVFSKMVKLHAPSEKRV